jgi:hypothetical protein
MTAMALASRRKAVHRPAVKKIVHLPRCPCRRQRSGALGRPAIWSGGARHIVDIYRNFVKSRFDRENATTGDGSSTKGDIIICSFNPEGRRRFQPRKGRLMIMSDFMDR